MAISRNQCAPARRSPRSRWQSVALNGNQSQSVRTCTAEPSISLAISGTQWQSVAISAHLHGGALDLVGNQWHSMAISRNQCAPARRSPRSRWPESPPPRPRRDLAWQPCTAPSCSQARRTCAGTRVHSHTQSHSVALSRTQSQSVAIGRTQCAPAPVRVRALAQQDALEP